MEKKEETVNDRIASYRKFAGLTQAQAASLLNMKRNTYARMEKMGKPTPQQLKQIAELFRISVAMLLYGEDYGEKHSNEDSSRLTFARPTYNDVFPLNPTEVNAIRIVREFDETDVQKVIDLINELYRKNLTSNKD